MLLKCCNDLDLLLRDGDERDINGSELYTELKIFKHSLNENMSAYQVLELALKCKSFPNVVIALRILLTIPITVASGERSFSTLKLIKNYLRSSSRLN